jgi:hypothetical protein
VQGSILMFSAPGLIFDSSEGVGSRFHVLRSRTHFQRFGGRRVPFSCFVLPDTFLAVARASVLISKFCALGHVSAVRRASGLFFMFCVPVLVFGDTEGVGSRFHVLCTRTNLWWYRRRPLSFSCFALTETFSAVCRPSGPVFMFCVPEHIFGGTNGVRSRFHVLRSQPLFRRCGRRQVPFHVLRSRTRIRRCEGRRVLFSCFALPYSFSAVPRASCPVYMFCAPGLIFGGSEGVGSRFHVLFSRTRFRQ